MRTTLLAVLLLAVAATSHAATPKKHRAAKPKVECSASDETQAARDKRLQRECKGRPNAGACLGYAS